jgi:hypothetical protein
MEYPWWFKWRYLFLSLATPLVIALVYALWRVQPDINISGEAIVYVLIRVIVGLAVIAVIAVWIKWIVTPSKPGSGSGSYTEYRDNSSVAPTGSSTQAASGAHYPPSQR